MFRILNNGSLIRALDWFWVIESMRQVCSKSEFDLISMEEFVLELTYMEELTFKLPKPA